MSTVIGEVGLKSRLGASGTFTNAATPSKLNACPTMPLANVAPFWSVPLLPSAISLALPSPGHQLTSPAGGGVQTTIIVGQTNFWMRLLVVSATKTFPLPSTATPKGSKNCPSPEPEIPAWHEEVQVSKAAIPSCTPQAKVKRKVPVFVNFWMRLLPLSATKTLPLPSTATPRGPLNCPLPEPGLPHMVRRAPAFVNFWMRLLSVSATKRSPLPSRATNKLNPNCPSPVPKVPHLVRKRQGASTASNS